MKVYLSVPIIANASEDSARAMAEAIEAAGHELTSPWVINDMETRPGERVNTFSRDTTAVGKCDVIIAEVSRPSTGVGMEVMTAHLTGKRIILVARVGSTVSRMLTDMEGTEWVYFTDTASLAGAIKEKLR